MAHPNIWYRIPPTRGVIAAGVASAFAAGGLFFYLVRNKKIFGGSIPRTLDPEWQAEFDRKANAWPREGGPPVALNPLTRENFKVTADNPREGREIRQKIEELGAPSTKEFLPSAKQLTPNKPS